MSRADDDRRSETRAGDGRPAAAGGYDGHAEIPDDSGAVSAGSDADADARAERRRRGLETMAAVYGWDVKDGPGDFFGLTVEHLFAEIWNREGLSFRDRRLLLIGLLVGQGLDDVVPIQLGAALGNGELSADDLREIVIFLTHYAGWPRGAKLNSQVDELLARR
ncbi:MAG: carboxymuconolactone decarboxylase family protein [Acidimicrobiales bacterium]